MYCRVLDWMSTDVSEVSSTSIRAMMEAARISETLVDIQSRTRQYIPEDSELHTRRRENFKSDIHALSWIRTHGLNYQVIKTYASDRAATGTG
jgi:hypothetical protein